MVFSKAEPKRTIRTIIRELVDRTNTDTSRIRILEQNSNTIQSRMDMVERNVVASRKLIDGELLRFSKHLDKTEFRLNIIESTIKEIIKEMKKLASTANIKELESLIEIYNPLKSNFATIEEVEALIEKKQKKNNEQNI